MISAVLFDLDGTLLDTALDFETATNQLLADEGMPALPINGIRAHVSNGSIGIIKSIFDVEGSDPECERLKNKLLAYYQACLADRTRLFPGLQSSLDLLAEKQIPWGIVTNKPSLYAEPIISAKVPECAVLVCPDHVSKAKPDPESLYLAAKQLDAKPENCIFVGDHKRDIDAGKAAGMETIAVGWGYIDHETENIHDWQATHLICETPELQTTLSQYYL